MKYSVRIAQLTAAFHMDGYVEKLRELISKISDIHETCAEEHEYLTENSISKEGIIDHLNRNFCMLDRLFHDTNTMLRNEVRRLREMHSGFTRGLFG